MSSRDEQGWASMSTNVANVAIMHLVHVFQTRGLRIAMVSHIGSLCFGLAAAELSVVAAPSWSCSFDIAGRVRLEEWWSAGNTLAIQKIGCC